MAVNGHNPKVFASVGRLALISKQRMPLGDKIV